MLLLTQRGFPKHLQRCPGGTKNTVNVSGIKNFKYKRDMCVFARVCKCPRTCVHASLQQSGEFGWAAVELVHLMLTNVILFREIKHMNVSEI